MNRRDFLRLAGIATLGIFAPKKAGTMLPNSTNRYGDMLKDILSGVQGVDQSKVELLQREMNELWSREIKYRSWLRLQDNKIDFRNLVLPFEPVYSNILEENKTSVTIEIPSTYNHIFIVVSGRTTGVTGIGDYIRCQFNGDTTGTNYAYQSVGATNGTVGNIADTSDPSIILGDLPTTNADANASGFCFGIISHLQDNNRWKSCMGIGGQWHTAAGGMSIFLVYGTWKSTNNVQNIKLVPDSNFIASTIISVYGMR